MNRFVVNSDVVDLLPGLEVVAVLARGINNKNANHGVNHFVHDTTKSTLASLEALPNAQTPLIAHYRETLRRQCNISAKKFPQSNESLYKRLKKSNGPLKPINAIVDFYNGVSIKHGVTAGAFDIQTLAKENKGDIIELRVSRDGDSFVALDASDKEAVSVPKGELSYCVGDIVLTRQLAWRQAAQGLVTENTQDVLFMSEVLYPKKNDDDVVSDLAEAVRKDLTEGLKDYFGVENPSSVILSKRSAKLMLEL